MNDANLSAPRITKENARELSLRGLEARRKNKAIREQEKRELNRLRQDAERVAALTPDERWTLSRLGRVRLNINSLQRLLSSAMAAGDVATVSALSLALDRMETREQILAARPLPGSLRPKSGSKSGHAFIDAEPLQVVVRPETGEAALEVSQESQDSPDFDDIPEAG